MSTEPGEFMSSVGRNQEQSIKMMEKVFSAAEPSAVYGEPLVSGAYTIITASEVGAGGGFGFGGGIGPSPEAGVAATQGESGTEPRTVQPRGSGGGGGGGSTGRPVAVIVVGPNGVEVKPVVDATKVALAGVTAWGAMLFMLLRWRRQARSYPPYGDRPFGRGGPGRLLLMLAGALLRRGREGRQR